MGDEKLQDVDVERSLEVGRIVEVDDLTDAQVVNVADLRKRLADSEIESQQRMNRILNVQGALLDRNQQLLEIQSVLLQEIKEGDGLSSEPLRKVGRILGMAVAT